MNRPLRVSRCSIPLVLVLSVWMMVSGCSPTVGSGKGTVASVPGRSGEAPFKEVAASAGITYRWKIDKKPPLTIRDTIGNGCAFLDYDNDGNLDILLVGSKVALYHGDGKGHFTDVSRETGIEALSGEFLGCAVGDYDNDGFPDIYISAYRGGVLLHNDHGKRFVDVTAQSGMKPQPWGTSCAWADYDNDGKLDLYVGNYVQFGPKTDPQYCNDAGVRVVCGPRFYKEEHGVLYRNLGNGKFADVTRSLGANNAAGKVLGVAWADYDGSGRQSLLLANDEMPGDLLKNDRKTLKNIGGTSGLAYDANGGLQGGMGVDWGDYDNDGKFDLVKATFQHEGKSVYHNDGHDLFTDNADMLGLSAALPYVSFGVKWVDYDNDGWLDLIFANGHVVDNISERDKSTTFRQPVQLFHNDKGGRFTEVPDPAGNGNPPIVGRGVAIGDYDNDGKVDFLIVDSDGAPLLLHNEGKGQNHSLTVSLVGRKSNRDAVGAIVTLESAGIKQIRRCGTDGSYLSASDRRIHFGLGETKTISKLTVHWPAGGTTVLKDVPADQPITVRE